MTSQFKKGIIELCVLKIIYDQPMAGVEVIEHMNQSLHVNENTIYPILRRLTSQQFFSTYKEDSIIGAPKKVYQITSYGEKHLFKMLEDWKDFLQDVTTILGGNHE